MKRLTLVAALVLALVFVLGACSQANDGFMTAKDKDALVAKYGVPQAKVILEYTLDGDTKTVELTYDLLLDKAPITVVNFINLVNQGYYNEKDVTTKDADGNDSVTAKDSFLIDGRVASSTNAYVTGRYIVRENSSTHGKTYLSADDLDYTIKGEFVSNGYVLDKAATETDEKVTDGNAKFQLFALAMYHENSVAAFDNADAKFFINLSSHTTENYKNYAVFAYLKSMTVKSGDNVIVEDLAGVDSEVLYDFANRFTTSTVSLENSTDRPSIVTSFRLVKIEMLGNADYSNLPTKYVIK